MKNLIVLLLLGAGGYFAYQNFFSGPGPVDTYKVFAKQWLKGDFNAAREFVGEGSLRDHLEDTSIYKIRFYYKNDEIIVKTVQFQMESENLSADGKEMSLQVKLVTFFDPPGVASQGGAMIAQFHHAVKLNKTGSGWKVTEFNPEFIKAEESPRYKKSRGG